MVCWPTVLCRRALRYGLKNGASKRLGTLTSSGAPLLQRANTSWCRLDPSRYSSPRPHGVACRDRDEQNTCVCQCLHPLCPVELFKVEIPNASSNLDTVESSYIVPWRCGGRHVRHADAQRGTPKFLYGEHSPTSLTPLISSLHSTHHTKMFSCSPHIPKATQISRRFSSKPAQDPTTQHAPKDKSDTAGPTENLPTTTTTTSALSQEPRPKGVVGYIIFRYTWYIERLQRSLESEMPRTFRMFRIFSVGLKAFIKDFTGYVRVLVQLSFPSERLEGLTLHQLQLYHFMPYDMFKVFPVLAISAIPFGQNLALPLGYFFPRQLLCRHFWDLQQSHDFAMRDLRRRVQYARPVFRCLQASVAGIEPLSERVRMQSVCHLLGSGRHPRDAQVLELRSLFSSAPYGLRHIGRHHVRSLLRLHGLSAVLRRKRLRDHARWLLCHDWALTAEARGLPPTDTALLRRDAGADSSLVEGSDQSPLLQCDLASLHVNVLKTSLLLRGISPIGLDSSGMARVLERWLTVSLQLSSADSSLLLHLPILLFYNHPTNMVLMAR